MRVEIHYRNPDDSFTHIANFEFETASRHTALEEAFRHTQNIEGSWSRGPMFEDGSMNFDYHSGIEVLVPLVERGGHLYGHRSSMVGDKFVIGPDAYEVDIVGFKKVK